MSSSSRISFAPARCSTAILLAAGSSEVEDSIHEQLSSDCRIQCAGSSGEIVGLAKAGHFDCALIDMARPAGDTVELLAHLREEAGQLPVLVLCSSPDIAAGVDAVRAGAADFIIKEVELGALAGRIAKLVDRAPAADGCGETAGKRPCRWTPGKMVTGDGPAMSQVMDVACKAVKYPVNVLIVGESGTGKELMARWVHQRSAGATGPFVAVNLAAIPSELVESTLFGHEKGAFTGASGPRVGKFAQSQGGTLLLDEITELRLDLQPKLLRVLQENEFERVGGDRTIRTDARVIATTNRDIEDAVRDGEFRSDLYYRLRVVTLRLPPLRERQEDIPELVDLFLDKYNRQYGCEVTGFATDALDMLTEYDWPGNIRELENAVQRAVICTERGEVRHPECFDLVGESRDGAASELAQQRGTLEELEQRYIAEVLQRTSGHQGNAAKILGIDRKTLYNKILKYGLGRGLKKSGSGGTNDEQITACGRKA